MKTVGYVTLESPVIVGYLDIWGQHSRTDVDVFSLQEAVTIDSCSLCHWQTMRKHLTRWDAGPSDVQGCVHLSNPRLALDALGASAANLGWEAAPRLVSRSKGG